jgi:hypothetical protein
VPFFELTLILSYFSFSLSLSFPFTLSFYLSLPLAHFLFLSSIYLAFSYYSLYWISVLNPHSRHSIYLFLLFSSSLTHFLFLPSISFAFSYQTLYETCSISISLFLTSLNERERENACFVS